MEERLTISKKALEELKRLAFKRGESLQRTFEHCVSTEAYMDKQRDLGRIVLVQDPNDDYSCFVCGYNSGSVYKVVFTYKKEPKD